MITTGAVLAWCFAGYRFPLWLWACAVADAAVMIPVMPVAARFWAAQLP